MTTIPVVDFQPCGLGNVNVAGKDLERVGRQLYNAFSTLGFAYIKNTGIAREVIDNVNEVSKKFFECEAAKKMKYTRNPDTRYGYVGIGEENLDPDKPGDYKEAFEVSGISLFAEDTDWPDAASPGFSTSVKQCMRQCKVLALRVLEAISLGMDLQEGQGLTNWHKLLHVRGNTTAMRSTYYPRMPDNYKGEIGVPRLGAHTDYGTITFLFQDNVGGLQIKNSEGKFIEATPIKDTVLVNIGDVLQYQTCGRLKSTVHRVRLPQTEKELCSVRQSIAYFVHADCDTIINQPLVYKDGCGNHVNHDENAKPITAGQHVWGRWSDSGLFY